MNIKKTELQFQRNVSFALASDSATALGFAGIRKLQGGLQARVFPVA